MSTPQNNLVEADEEEASVSEQTNQTQEILHHKCTVIKLVLEQIGNIREHDGCEVRTSASVRGSLTELIQKQKNLVLTVILLLSLFWFVFLYGAFKGAAICTGSTRSKVCAKIESNFPIIPGIIFQ